MLARGFLHSSFFGVFAALSLFVMLDVSAVAAVEPYNLQRSSQNLQAIAGHGTRADLARLLRGWAQHPQFDLGEFERSIRSISPDGFKVPVDMGEAQLFQWNATLHRSGFSAVQFVPSGKHPPEFKISAGLAAWILARKLVLPVAVFLSAYALGLYELQSVYRDLALAASTPISQVMNPVIAAGTAAAVLSFIFELPRRWWKDEVFSGRLGRVYEAGAHFLIPAFVRLTQIIVIMRPGEWGSNPLPLSTQFWIPVGVSSVSTFILARWTESWIRTLKKSRDISPAREEAINFQTEFLSQIGRVTLLTSQSPLMGLALLSLSYFTGPLRISFRERWARPVYESMTAAIGAKASGRTYPFLSPLGFCARTIASLVMAFPRASRELRPLLEK